MSYDLSNFPDPIDLKALGIRPPKRWMVEVLLDGRPVYRIEAVAPTIGKARQAARAEFKKRLVFNAVEDTPPSWTEST